MRNPQVASNDPRLQVFSAAALLDAAIFGVIAFGIRKESRVAAVAALAVYIVEQLYMLSRPGFRGVGTLFVVFALISAFIGGIRGTFALHAMRERGEA